MTARMGVAHCCGYFGATLMVLIASIVMVSLAISYSSYFLALFYEHGICVVTKTIYTVQFACECGKDCKSAYPCLLIYAKLNSSSLSNHEQQWPIPIYDDDWQQVVVIENWESDFVERCSLRVCNAVTQDNRDAIERYRLQYGTPGRPYSCHFRPGNTHRNGAVFHQRIPWTLALHIILWPSLAICSGVLLCLYLWLSRRCSREENSSRRDIERRSYMRPGVNYNHKY